MNEHDSPRAWHKSRKEMLAVLSINWDTHGDITVLELVGQKYRDGDERAILEVGLNEVELMWPTGLRDKKAHGIYQEDVYKTPHGTGPVIWVGDGWYIEGVNRLGPYTRDGEIIGNKYENPELMEPKSP